MKSFPTSRAPRPMKSSSGSGEQEQTRGSDKCCGCLFIKTKVQKEHGRHDYRELGKPHDPNLKSPTTNTYELAPKQRAV